MLSDQFMIGDEQWALMEPLLMIDGLGFYWGQWVILSVKEDQDHHLADGAPRRQTYQLALQRYQSGGLFGWPRVMSAWRGNSRNSMMPTRMTARIALVALWPHGRAAQTHRRNGPNRLRRPAAKAHVPGRLLPQGHCETGRRSAFLEFGGASRTSAVNFNNEIEAHRRQQGNPSRPRAYEIASF